MTTIMTTSAAKLNHTALSPADLATTEPLARGIHAGCRLHANLVAIALPGSITENFRPASISELAMAYESFGE